MEREGRKCVLMSGDLSEPAFCRGVIHTAVEELGGIDILVNNAAYQMTHGTLEEISDEEWEYTCIAPGPVWTPFGIDTPLGRAGQPVELAPVCELLGSDESSYITGARIALTGGRLIL